MKKYLLFLALGFSCSMVACKKDSSDPAPTPTPQPVAQPTANTRLISGKNWKLHSLTRSDIPGDMVTYIPACQQDNVYIFEQTLQLRVDEGKVTCSPSTATQGTWAFKNNETVVNISIPSLQVYGLSGDFEVVSLTATTLELRRVEGTTNYAASFNL